MASIVVSSLCLSSSAEENQIVSLKDAFDAGAVSLTFIPEESGGKLEVRVDRMDERPLIAQFDKGTTVFEFFSEQVSVSSDRTISIDLREAESASFLVRQEGNTLTTSGVVMWRKLPAE